MQVTNAQLLDAMANQIDSVLSTASSTAIQVMPRRVQSPTPPCIDMFPGDVGRGSDSAGFGGRGEYVFTVRTRVMDNDDMANQDLLLQLHDDGALSVIMALLEDPTLAGLASSVHVPEDQITGFGSDPFGDQALLQFLFTCIVIPADS